MFAKNLSVMVDAGLSVSRALNILEKQLKNKKFIEILKSVGVSVNGGETLSNSLAKHPKTFSDLFVAMVKAGEESGKLSNSLKKNKRSHDLSRCDCIGDGGHRSSPYGLYGADVNRNL